MELEQDAAEMRSFSNQSQAAINEEEEEEAFSKEPVCALGRTGKDPLERGSFGSKRGSYGSSSDRAEERVLRAKNEMLERQLEHMKEEAEETELELAAARKVRVPYHLFGTMVEGHCCVRYGV